MYINFEIFVPNLHGIYNYRNVESIYSSKSTRQCTTCIERPLGSSFFSCFLKTVVGFLQP